MGVFCRRVGVLLIDGGTVRFPRIIGLDKAMTLILTGRFIGAQEALSLGPINRISASGKSLNMVKELVKQIASFPKNTMLGDRRSTYKQCDMILMPALNNKLDICIESLSSIEYLNGAQVFSLEQFRHGFKQQ